jgi:M6 family metalloprotease-like protein
MPKFWREQLLLTKLMILSVFIGLGLVSIAPIWATEPARPGEIERLRATGEFESRLDFVLKMGNHKFSPDLVKKYKYKIQQLQGIHTLAPPGGSDFASIGSVKIFALLIDFNDHAHSNSETVIDSMLFGDGDPAKYPLESLRDYYDRSSYGLLEVGGSTLGWYTTSYDRSTITEDATGRDNLIKEALDHFDPTHDFSQYDNDGDGDIDYFVVMWAGPNTGWGTFWWGYQTSFSNPSYTIDGKKLTKYSWQWESNSPTVVIHETGHGLGLPDLYDYDPLLGPGSGVGGLDMMDGNAGDLNCFFKWMLDWLNPMVVSGGKQTIMLDPTATSTDAVLIWPGIGLGDIFSEFFMAQNRQDVANDAGFWFAPDGLSIWHIDTTLNSGGTGFAYNNSTTDHKLIRLMEADGLEEIEAYACCKGCSCKIADIGDLYNEGDRLSDVTTPSSAKYDGTESCVTVCDIIDHGVDAAISATFNTYCSLPPTSDIGGPYSAECQGGTTEISLDGTGSSDPDFDDSLFYEWTTDCAGASFDDSSSPTPLLTVDTSNGCSISCNVTLTVTDCAGNSDTSSVPVTIQDTTPPDIVCPEDITLECVGNCGFDASDPQLAPFFAGFSATDLCDGNLFISNDAPSFFGLGTFPVTFTATDYCGNSASCTATVTVEDTTPPEIEVTLNRYVIWPPNHKLIEIDATVLVTDSCDPDASFVLTSITSDEPDEGLGDGDTANDIQDAEFGTADTNFKLRAERSGTGDGRTYTIVYTAYDSCDTTPNNTTTVTVYVVVPKSRR